jgi:hypothetical protein
MAAGATKGLWSVDESPPRSRSRPDSGREKDTGCGHFLCWFDLSIVALLNIKGELNMREETQPRARWVRCLFLLMFLQGCAVETTHVTEELGVPLQGYQILQVLPATNQTGQTFSFDISSFFTDELESDLRTKAHQVSAPGQVQPKTLIIKCSILSYSPATAGKTAEATALGFLPGGFYFAPQDTTKVKADLIDQQSGRIVANVISIQSQPESGLVPLVSVGDGHGVSVITTQKLVLRNAAWGIASKIDAKMMQP